MNPMSMVQMFLGMLPSMPGVGPYVGTIVTVAGVLVVACSALVGVWHALIQIVVSVTAIPGLQKYAPLADKMRIWDTEAEGVLNAYVLPFLNRLSVLPVPQKAVRKKTA